MKYVIGQHCNNMEKYANTICVLVTHVSYTELREHDSHIFQYSSIPELRQLYHNLCQPSGPLPHLQASVQRRLPGLI